MLGFHSFWSNFPVKSSNIDGLLERVEKIEDILEEENIINNIKQNSQKFGSFIQKNPKYIKQLIDYLIIEPEDQNNFKKSFKQSYTFYSAAINIFQSASEIFGLEISEVMNAFFNETCYNDQDGASNSNDKESENSLESEDDDDDEDNSLRDESTSEENDNQNSAQANNETSEEDDDEYEEIDEDDDEGDDEDDLEDSENTDSKEEEETSTTKIKSRKNDMRGDKLLDYFFTFLNKKASLNQTLCGYFVKAINAIFNKNGAKLVKYIFEKDEIMNQLINQIESKSLCDLVLRLLLIDIPFNESYQTSYIKEREKMIDGLYQKFFSNESHFQQENISFIFCELINKINMCNSGNKIIQIISKRQYLDQLFSQLDQKDNTLLFYSASIINTIFQYYSSGGISCPPERGSFNQSQDQDESEQKEIKVIDSLNLLQVTDGINENIEKLINITFQSSNIDPIQMQFGQTIIPFGSGKLKILETIDLSLTILINAQKLENITEQFEKVNYLQYLVSLIKTYKLNNFLHKVISQIFIQIIELEEPFYALKEQLFHREKGNLLEFLSTELIEFDSYYSENKKNKQEKGYMGYVIILLSYIQMHEETCYLIQNYCQEIPQYELCYEIFDQTKQIEEMDLGNSNPRINLQNELIENQQKNTNEIQQEIELDQIFKKFSDYFSTNQSSSSQQYQNPDAIPEQDMGGYKEIDEINQIDQKQEEHEVLTEQQLFQQDGNDYNQEDFQQTENNEKIQNDSETQNI